MSDEYQRMKKTWWALWPLVIQDLNSHLLHNRPERFEQTMRKLRSQIDLYLEGNTAVVACVGVARKGPGCLQDRLSPLVAGHKSPGGRSAVSEAVRDSPGTCETCFHWRRRAGGKTCHVCKCEHSPRWMIASGAGNSCTYYVKRISHEV